MLDIIFSPVKNTRTEDGQWEDMRGCHSCGKVSSAYIRLDIYDRHLLICRGINICKGCLNKCEMVIAKTILS